MSSDADLKPVIIPPLRSGEIKLVREAKQRERHSAEHPHCDEHFLFTPHCAACLEAEQAQSATAYAEPLEALTPPKSRASSSRSFGFTGSIPPNLFEPRDRLLGYSEGQDITDIVIALLLDM